MNGWIECPDRLVGRWEGGTDEQRKTIGWMHGQADEQKRQTGGGQMMVTKHTMRRA